MFWCIQIPTSKTVQIQEKYHQKLGDASIWDLSSQLYPRKIVSISRIITQRTYIDNAIGNKKTLRQKVTESLILKMGLAHSLTKVEYTQLPHAVIHVFITYFSESR